LSRRGDIGEKEDSKRDLISFQKRPTRRARERSRSEKAGLRTSDIPVYISWFSSTNYY
jgi:hypothetical protein